MDKPTDWRSGTRRIFSNEFKLHMVELASKPNANVAQLEPPRVSWRVFYL